jgi:hypothetical protein
VSNALHAQGCQISPKSPYESPTLSTMKKLILAAGRAGLAAALLSGSVFAQNTIIVVPPADPYAAAIIQWETYLALAPTPARVTIAVATVWIKCGHVQGFTVQYTNGVVYRSTDAPETKPVDHNLLANLVATGKVAVVDEDALFGAQCPP